MRRLLIAPAALALLLSPLASAAGADHGEPYSKEGACGSGTQKATGITEVNTPAGLFYIDDRNYLLGNGLWIYQETNKIKHLQRETGTKADTHLDAHPNKDICTDYAGADPTAEGFKPDRCIN